MREAHRCAAVEIVAAFGPFGRRLTEAHVDEVAECIARHAHADLLGDLASIGPWPGAVDALARRRGVLAACCIDCGAVYAVRPSEGGCAGASHGICEACYGRRRAQAGEAPPCGS